MPDRFNSLIRPLLFRLPPETAHEAALALMRVGMASEAAMTAAEKRYRVTGFGEIRRFGLKFENPLGVAAGFDKNGAVVNQLAAFGFGFVEVGTVTLEPQPGNPKPRLFRLPDDEALINRLGFNNEGARSIAGRLKELMRRCVIGVNIGKNKDVNNESAVENYLHCFDLVYDAADYIAINVSSPNTPNLRELQHAENLERLLAALQDRNRELAAERTLPAPKPILVKIAPDLSDAEVESIAETCTSLGIAGIIATNTTTGRAGLRTPDVERIGAGGLSGRPLASRSTEVISRIFRHTSGQLPIVGVGGIFSGADAFEKIAAGAGLVQVYTGFIYNGPGFAHRVNTDLKAILSERGFENIDAAVGSAVR